MARTTTLQGRIVLAAVTALLLGMTSPAAAETPTLVVDGRLIDGTGADPIQNGRVVIREGRIACAGTVAACPTPSDAAVIEAKGGSIIPGLIDLHAHPRPHYFGWFLASGVTTVRSANTALDQVATLEALSAPRAELIWAGPMLDGEASIIRRFFDKPAEGQLSPARPADGLSLDGIELLIAQTPEQAVAAVDALTANGADWVKLYEQMPPEAFVAATRRAREKGLPVMADLGMASTRGLNAAQVDLLQAAEAGVDSLEHASGAALAYQRLGGDLTAATLDPALIDQLARALLDTDTALIPTFSVFHLTGSDEPPEAALKGLPFADASGAVRDGLNHQWRGIHGHFHAKAAESDKARLDTRIGVAVARRLAELGGRVGAGSDTPAGAYNLPGGGLHLELELMTRAGFTPLQALSAATGTAADILGRDDIGVIAPDRRADLLIVEGDPSRDIRDTRRLRHVIRAGQVLDPAQLRDQTLSDGDARLAALIVAEAP